MCFVFSKKRCEDNASSLGGTDLCTSSEKSMVHITVERALKRLKGEFGSEWKRGGVRR